MLQKPLLLLALMGIAIGLFIGIIDSILHFVNFEDLKIANIVAFLLFFIGIYWSVSFFRQKIKSGIITYGGAFKNFLYIGFIASLIIALVRFTFLQYLFNFNIDTILNQTKQSLTDSNSGFTVEQLSFIEFSYSPIVSSVMYFVYYSIFVIIFAFLASFFIKRENINKSL